MPILVWLHCQYVSNYLNVIFFYQTYTFSSALRSTSSFFCLSTQFNLSITSLANVIMTTSIICMSIVFCGFRLSRLKQRWTHLRNNCYKRFLHNEPTRTNTRSNVSAVYYIFLLHCLSTRRLISSSCPTSSSSVRSNYSQALPYQLTNVVHLCLLFSMNHCSILTSRISSFIVCSVQSGKKLSYSKLSEGSNWSQNSNWTPLNYFFVNSVQNFLL